MKTVLILNSSNTPIKIGCCLKGNFNFCFTDGNFNLNTSGISHTKRILKLLRQK